MTKVHHNPSILKPYDRFLRQKGRDLNPYFMKMLTSGQVLFAALLRVHERNYVLFVNDCILFNWLIQFTKPLWMTHSWEELIQCRDKLGPLLKSFDIQQRLSFLILSFFKKFSFEALWCVVADHCSASVQVARELIIFIARNKHEWTSEGTVSRFNCGKTADSMLWFVRSSVTQTPAEGWIHRYVLYGNIWIFNHLI